MDVLEGCWRGRVGVRPEEHWGTARASAPFRKGEPGRSAASAGQILMMARTMQQPRLSGTSLAGVLTVGGRRSSRYTAMKYLLFLVLVCAGQTVAFEAAAALYKLPWAPEIPMLLTQDCDVADYVDHVGSKKFAWDFANGARFPIRAARGGVITHLKRSSGAGCSTAACVNQANYAVIDHGDGTASIYLHLDQDSGDARISCGKPVAQGELIGLAGSTGWSTSPHLHFQVNLVRPQIDRVCECGKDGQSCAADFALWSAFWSSPAYPSQPITFEEWPATPCGNRRMALPVSQNTMPLAEEERTHVRTAAWSAAMPAEAASSATGGACTAADSMELASRSSAERPVHLGGGCCMG